MIRLSMSRVFVRFSQAEAGLACALAAGLGAVTPAAFAQQPPAQLHVESRGGPAHSDAAKPAAGKPEVKDPQPAAPQSAAAVAAAPARVTLNQGQLTVSANNSDLRSILTEVASSGGMTIEGLDKSSRVFGQYGPGAPRDVLTALLDDTGYNFVMLGGANGGVPRELVLTTRGNSLPHPHAQAAAPDDDANADDQEPLGPGAIPHPPPEPSDDPQERAQQHLQNLQRMQDILQQRQEQQEQQQEQQDNNPQ